MVEGRDRPDGKRAVGLELELLDEDGVTTFGGRSWCLTA